jgi:hypothetical protein
LIRSLLFLFFINTQFDPSRAPFCPTRCSFGTFHHSCSTVLSHKTLLRDSSPLLQHRFVSQDALAGQFTPATAPFCPTRRSCGSVHPCSSSILSHKTLLRDSSPLLQHRFVPQDALARQFTPATAPFCPESPSFGTVHPCCSTVLSRITLFRDSSPLLKLRFVPNHPLARQFTPAQAPFCPTRRSCGTVRSCSSTVLSHKTLLRDSSPLLQHRFVPQDALARQFTPATTPFCLTRCSCGTVHPCYNTVLSRIILFRDNSPLLQHRFVPQDALAGQFTPAAAPFCPKTLLRDSSPLLEHRFVPNHTLTKTKKTMELNAPLSFPLMLNAHPQ